MGRTAPEGVLQLQRTIGNQAVTRLLDGAGQAPGRPSGQPLDPDTRQLMEARFGYDLSGVRVHRDPAATRQVGANAFTVGRDVVLGAGAPSPETEDGQRLLAHELAHVVQQQGAAGGQAAPTAAAESEADAAATAVTHGQGFAVQAHTGVTAARNGPSVPLSPLKLPDEGVDMPWVGFAAPHSELGYLRDPQHFWTRFQASYGDRLSPANQAHIAAGRVPEVDPTWISFYPQHAAYAGEKLEHHHVGQGARAVPLPETLHDAYTVFHPQRRVAGTPGGGTRPLPPQPTRQRTEAEIRRHVTQGRIRGQGITAATPPPAPAVPVASELAADPGTLAQVKASGTPPATPAAVSPSTPTATPAPIPQAATPAETPDIPAPAATPKITPPSVTPLEPSGTPPVATTPGAVPTVPPSSAPVPTETASAKGSAAPLVSTQQGANVENVGGSQASSKLVVHGDSTVEPPTPRFRLPLVKGIVAALFTLAAGLFASKVEADVAAERAAAKDQADAPRLQQEIQARLNAQRERWFMLQAANPAGTVWARITYDRRTWESFVVAGGGDALTDYDYEGTFVVGVELLLAPVEPPTITRTERGEGSAAQGGTRIHEFVTQSVALQQPPFQELIAHAKANNLPLEPLTAYAAARLDEAGQASDVGRGSRASEHWATMLDLLNQP